MSMIRINDSFDIEGKFSFEVSYDRGKNPVITEISGIITARGYLPDVRTIENERYRLGGVFVYKESYGSEEDEMAFHFVAKTFAIANSLQGVNIHG